MGSLYQISLLKSQESTQKGRPERWLEPKIVDDSKETLASVSSRADTGMRSWTLGPHTQDPLKLYPDKISTRRSESRHKILPLTRSYLWMIPVEKGKNQFSPMERHHMEYQPYSRASPMPRNSWSTQNGFHVAVVYVHFVLILFGLIIFHLFFICLFLFCFHYAFYDFMTEYTLGSSN